MPAMEKLTSREICERIATTEGFNVEIEGRANRILEVSLSKRKSPDDMKLSIWLRKTFPNNFDEVKVLRPNGRPIVRASLSSIRLKYPTDFLSKEKSNVKQKLKLEDKLSGEERKHSTTRKKLLNQKKKVKQVEQIVSEMAHQQNTIVVDAEHEAGAQVLAGLLREDNSYHPNVIELCSRIVENKDVLPDTEEVIDYILRCWSAALRS